MDSLPLNIIALVSTHAENNHRSWKWAGYAFCTDYHHETANPKIWKTHRKPTQKDYAEQTLETFCWIRSRKAPSTHSSAKLGWLTGIFIHRLFHVHLFNLWKDRRLKLAVQPKKNTSTCSFADLWKDDHVMSMSPNKMKSSKPSVRQDSQSELHPGAAVCFSRESSDAITRWYVGPNKRFSTRYPTFLISICTQKAWQWLN